MTHTNGTTEAVRIFFWNIDSENDGITYVFSFYAGLRLLETCDGSGILLDSVLAARVRYCVGSIAPSSCVTPMLNPWSSSSALVPVYHFIVPCFI